MSRATWAWLVFGIVLPLAMFLLAKSVFGVTLDDLIAQLSTFRDASWAIPVTLVLFVVLAFVGAPQWMMVTAAIVTFGLGVGGVVSWVGSLLSAPVGFWLGRTLGAARLARFDAGLVTRLSGAVRRNGFMTSLAVRVVPTGPALLVNLAAGVSGMQYTQFVAGTAVGIIPKIVVIALLSQGVISGLSGSLLGALFAVLAVAAFAMNVIARKRLIARTRANREKSQ